MGMRGRSRLFGNVREGGSFVSSSRAGFFSILFTISLLNRGRSELRYLLLLLDLATLRKKVSREATEFFSFVIIPS